MNISNSTGLVKLSNIGGVQRQPLKAVVDLPLNGTELNLEACIWFGELVGGNQMGKEISKIKTCSGKNN